MRVIMADIVRHGHINVHRAQHVIERVKERESPKMLWLNRYGAANKLANNSDGDDDDVSIRKKSTEKYVCVCG